MVLALVAVLAGIVSGNAGAFILGTNVEPPGRVLKRASLDALYFSGEKKEEVFLSWLDENATFLIKDKSGLILERHSIYEEINDEIRNDNELMPKVTFHAIPPSDGVDGRGSNLSEDELYLSFIRFHSGCSPPFFAEIEFRGVVEKLNFDPFSGYVLQKDDGLQ